METKMTKNKKKKMKKKMKRQQDLLDLQRQQLEQLDGGKGSDINVAVDDEGDNEDVSQQPQDGGANAGDMEEGCGDAVASVSLEAAVADFANDRLAVNNLKRSLDDAEMTCDAAAVDGNDGSGGNEGVETNTNNNGNVFSSNQEGWLTIKIKLHQNSC